METLSPQLFALFTRLVEDACGLHYDLKDRELFGSKLATRAGELGFDNLLDFYYRIRYDDPQGDEMRKLVEALVVHETYFFRELEPLRQLVATHLANVVERRGHARVWSAACATGEEPYTLAMVLDAAGLGSRVQIVASDISRTAIERARAGRYGRRSLRGPAPDELARYLDISEREVSVRDELRGRVAFDTRNLLEPWPDGPAFDAILCRNVLIYFSDETVTRAVKQLHERLAVGGLVSVGVSESLLRFGTALVCEERGRAFFYKRVS